MEVRRQIYSKAQLLDHWSGWGESRIRRELRQRVGLRFGPGQRWAVDRSHVETIDAQLDREAANVRRRSTPLPTGQPNIEEVLRTARALLGQREVSHA